MVRLKDLPDYVAQGLLNLPMPDLGEPAWTAAKPPADARIAIVTTAGLHRHTDAKFVGGAADYRLLPDDIDPADILMSHVSINFDRSGFQQDVNIVFPLERLHELADDGEIGSVARWHYSFMGATDPTRMEENARQLAKLLHDDRVDGVILVPV